MARDKNHVLKTKLFHKTNLLFWQKYIKVLQASSVFNEKMYSNSLVDMADGDLNPSLVVFHSLDMSVIIMFVLQYFNLCFHRNRTRPVQCPKVGSAHLRSFSIWTRRASTRRLTRSTLLTTWTTLTLSWRRRRQSASPDCFPDYRVNSRPMSPDGRRLNKRVRLQTTAWFETSSTCPTSSQVTLFPTITTLSTNLFIDL